MSSGSKRLAGSFNIRQGTWETPQDLADGSLISHRPLFGFAAERPMNLPFLEWPTKREVPKDGTFHKKCKADFDHFTPRLSNVPSPFFYFIIVRQPR